jgi:leucyl aminopeptidase
MDVRVVIELASGWAEVATDALLVVVIAGTSPASIGGAVGEALALAVADGDLEHKAGRCAYIARPAGLRAKRLVLAIAKDDSAKAFRAAAAAGLGVVKPLGVEQLAVACSAEISAAHAQALVTAVGDATYLYSLTKPSAPKPPKLRAVTLLCGAKAAADVRAGVTRGKAITAGITLAREFANRPANHCTPTVLADEARRQGKAHDFKVEVLGLKEVEKLGMGSFMAVAQASSEPLRFIVMHYRGAGKTDAPLVLVGKGITFDTGGISLKPGAEMDEMKFDMGGAASVLGTMRAVAELKPKMNLVGIIASCENMPGGNAVKPGDVVKSMSGQTIEILNTDAEGRLILCDALTYAERFEPAAVVDIATLTGACVVALGHHHSGLFAADEDLAAKIQAASADALDPCWRMPLDEEYDDGLKSNFADMANIGSRAGGAITAAMFLKRFTAKYRWAHLDIAGTAWKSGSAKGGTGRPVGLLTHLALGMADAPIAAMAKKPPTKGVARKTPAAAKRAPGKR